MTRWKQSEPVRLYLYGILGPALIVLMAYGFVTSEQMAVWGGLGAALLTVPGVEAARAKVTSPAKVAVVEPEPGVFRAGPAGPIREGEQVDVTEAEPTKWT